MICTLTSSLDRSGFLRERPLAPGNVICEEKHMGSHAVVIVCRDEHAARERFGVVDDGIGTYNTRTGRRFFNDDAVEAEFLQRINAAIERTGLWQDFDTDWLCLDCELMPWPANPNFPLGV